MDDYSKRLDHGSQAVMTQLYGLVWLVSESGARFILDFCPCIMFLIRVNLCNLWIL